MDIEEMLNRYRELGDRYAPARAKRGYLEDYKKSMVAMLMKEVERTKGITTASGQEREALANEQYVAMLKELQVNGRLVGIISHVGDLRQHIDARLTLTRTPNGSTATFHL